ncbi:Modulator of FtsH protease HflK [Symmachiella macrocystis]|uniref:Modulator of FtsH protease HflK n=1 Tax=Symmachiella macrocystis TaxID=2527985 RepID=A0A5C6BMJ3_9PLAN|nr:protease modulator HflK [Symmachiella macrocystis]TWU11724.1 Modulator of FtsH protease HflK [Symmachiella macrocystis]
MSERPPRMTDDDASDDGFVPPHVPLRPRREDRFSMAEGVRAGSKMIGWLALGLFALFWCSGITTIGPGEVGLVLRCGRLTGSSPVDQVQQSGLLLALPYPIDEVIRVPVKQEREIVINALRSELNNPGAMTGQGLPGYALSGNQNIVEADITLKYRISDPIAYTFSNREPERILRDAVIGAAAELIAQWKVDDVLRLQRQTELGPEKLAHVVLVDAQALIDSMNLGVELTAVEFREIQPPAEVADAFQAVQSERIAIETKKRDAEGYAARIVPAAEAESNSLIQQATRRATDQRTRAEEEVELFNRVHGEYVRNPGLVWNRLHLETIEGLMRDGGQFQFVDSGTRLVLTSGSRGEKTPGTQTEPTQPTGGDSGALEVQP